MKIVSGDVTIVSGDVKIVSGDVEIVSGYVKNCFWRREVMATASGDVKSKVVTLCRET